MLLDIVIPVFIVILAWFITNSILFVKMRLKELSKEQKNESDIIYINVERIEDKYIFVYDLQTSKFLVQVKTYNEMIEFFQTNYPYNNVIAAVENIEEIFGEDYYESI